MKKNHQHGFTLIELLVVIAIIGILAALVLVALGNARDKANDAKIKSDIGQLRTLAEVLYDSNSASYSTVGGTSGCFTSPSSANCNGDTNLASSVSTLKSDLTSAGSASFVANSSTTAFCVSGTLKTSGRHACMDASGAYKEGTAGCGSATACP